MRITVREGIKSASIEPPDDRWPAAPHSLESALGLLERRPAIPEPLVPARWLGLTRQGNCAKASDEVRLVEERGWRPRPDVEPVRFGLPIDWGMDPFGDRNWRAQLNMLRIIDPFIRAYEAEPGAAFLDRALALCVDWHAFHSQWRNTHSYSWPDMIVGSRAQRLAYLIEKVRRGTLAAGPEERRALAGAFVQHWARLTSPGFFRYTNHTIPDIHGLTALARVGIDEAHERSEWEAAIGRHLAHVLDLQFDAHGLHRENSPEYHFVARNMLATLHRSNWYTASCPRLGETLASAEATGNWMRYPDGRVLPVGDSGGSMPTARMLPAPSASTALDRLDSINHSCWCMVRRTNPKAPERWSLLAIKAGFDLVTHKHNDELSYVWAETGCDIVVDPGKYAYFTDLKRSYVVSARAHNLVEFERRDFNTRAEDTTGHVVHERVEHPWGVEVVAELVQQPIGIRQQRRWLFAPGCWLVIVDAFDADDDVAFTQWTHLASEFTVELGRGGGSARHSGGGTLALRWWSSEPIEPRVDVGTEGPRMQGWVSRSYRSLEPAPALGLAGVARSAIVATALSLRSDVELAVQPDGMLRWICGADQIALLQVPAAANNRTLLRWLARRMRIAGRMATGPRS